MKAIKRLRCVLLVLAAFLYLSAGELRAEWNECDWTTPEVGDKACDTDYMQVLIDPGDACTWWCNNDIEDTCSAFCGEDYNWDNDSYCGWDLLIPGNSPTETICVNWYIHCECE